MKNSGVILTIFFTVFFVTSLFGFFAYRYSKSIKNNNLSLLHSNIVLYKSEKALSILKDIETGTRGFLITGDDAYLEKYNKWKDMVDTIMHELKTLTRDNPVQHSAIDSIAVLTASKLQSCKMMQDFRRSDSFSLLSVQPLMLSNKQVMDSITFLMVRIQTNERNLLTSSHD